MFWRRLLHRWLVEYNPLYLLSAAFVLGGVNVVSGELADARRINGAIGGAAIAEVYAWALIAGAAFLTRIGLRRPAVLLALITALYQCDPTLHLETSAFLGAVGLAGTSVWLASFVGKLLTLAWALRVRLSRSALVAPVIGAVGLAVFPHVLRAAEASATSSLVGLWVFGVLAAGLWTTRRVTSCVALDSWGQTVLRRAVRSIEALWVVLLGGHLALWSTDSRFQPLVLVPVALLLATRALRSEAGVWTLVGGTVFLTGATMPSFFAATATMAGAALALRALRKPHQPAPADRPEPTSPYRATPPQKPRTEWPPLTFVQAKRAARLRLLTGSLYAAYLSAWTAGWSGGDWPAHMALLDVVLTAAVVLIVWRLRIRAALVPLGAVYFHLAVQTRLIVAPTTPLAWGAVSVGTGFAMLILSVAASWWFRPRLDHRAR